MFAALSTIGNYGVVGFNDLSGMDEDPTHFAMTRTYAIGEMGGVLMPPVYHHFFSDNEVARRAERIKRYAYTEDGVLEHMHPYWNKAKFDDVYRSVEPYYDDDNELYLARSAAGFPNVWAPVIGTPARTDWGRVAVASRIAKHPEALFFNSWTHLLVSGIQEGDIIITAPIYLPAHVAANEIVRAFLRTDADSLLFIDDDMTFAPQALTQLRSNYRTQEAAIAQAFCTHKTHPPHAIALHRMPVPDMPEALWGDKYGALGDIGDGEVVEVDAVGLGFTLIKRHVFESMLSEYGAANTFWFEWGRGTQGEDIVFSQKCARRDLRMVVDAGVKVGHVGMQVFGWDMHQQWLNRSKNG